MTLKIGLQLWNSFYIAEATFGLVPINPLVHTKSAFGLYFVILFFILIVINVKRVVSFFSKENLDKWDTFMKPFQRTLSSFLALFTIGTLIWGVVTNFNFIRKDVRVKLTFKNQLTEEQDELLDTFQVKGMHKDIRLQKSDSMQKVKGTLTAFVYFDYSIVDSLSVKNGDLDTTYSVPYRAEKAHVFFKKLGGYPMNKGEFQIPSNNVVETALTFY